MLAAFWQIEYIESVVKSLWLDDFTIFSAAPCQPLALLVHGCWFGVSGSSSSRDDRRLYGRYRQNWATHAKRCINSTTGKRKNMYLCYVSGNSAEVLSVQIILPVIPHPSSCRHWSVFCRRCCRSLSDGLELLKQNAMNATSALSSLLKAFAPTKAGGRTALIHARCRLPLWGPVFAAGPPLLFWGRHGNSAMTRGAKRATGGEHVTEKMSEPLPVRVFVIQRGNRTNPVAHIKHTGPSAGGMTRFLSCLLVRSRYPFLFYLTSWEAGKMNGDNLCHILWWQWEQDVPLPALQWLIPCGSRTKSRPIFSLTWSKEGF